MKLITYYTETHKKLYDDFFIESLKKYNEFDIISKIGTQHSTDGGYFSKGFNETTKDKINFLLENLESVSYENELVLFSDVDVIFLEPIKDFLLKFNKYDLTFQNGIGGLNTGFFLIKNNEVCKNLLRDVIKNCHLYENDQIALNSLISNHKVNYTIFDNEILSFAHLYGPKIWKNEQFEIPNNTIVFHACWCEGVDNKIKLLEYVRNYKKSKT